jgi:hypothetical protein
MPAAIAWGEAHNIHLYQGAMAAPDSSTRHGWR